ncbi:MAG: HlyD family efflux transporter periplasmic adaptor subunit [Gammaproteobacteria bacterium]|nr:HlyD family efflux transporter periplasmic adaptor subunit [Gammaproteobacteria bacterium]
MSNKKLIRYLIFIVVIIAFFFMAIQSKPITVDSAKVAYKPMKVIFEEEGKTRVIDRYVVTAPIDAYMQRITLNIGDTVQKGQSLLTLEPLPSSILDPRSRSQSVASLGATKELENIIQEMTEAAKADKELADITFHRSSQLYEDKVIAQYEMDIAKAEKRRADAVYRASQFGNVFTQYLTQMSRSALDFEDVRQMNDDQRKFNVTSISNGQVLKIADKSERVISMGEVLIEIGDIKRLEIESDVLSSLAIKLKSGMPVEISRWGGKQILHGIIQRIEPSGFTKLSALGVEEQRVKVIIKMDSERDSKSIMPSGLKDGFRVVARFVVWQSDKNVLQIPNSALFKDRVDEQWAVYVIKDNYLQKRNIKIGHKNNLMVEVIEGLKENEQLVSYLSNDLKEGIKVTIRK